MEQDGATVWMAPKYTEVWEVAPKDRREVGRRFRASCSHLWKKMVSALQNRPVGISEGSSSIASPTAWWGVDESILYVQGNMMELIFWLLWGQSVKILFVPCTLLYASAQLLLPSTLNFPDTQGLGKNAEAPWRKYTVMLRVGKSGRSLCLQPEGELEMQLCHGKEL